MPPARLADSRRTRRSPPEQGRSPTFRAAMASYQSMTAIREVPSLLLVPVSMKRAAKSSRWRNVPLLMSSWVPASRGSSPAAQLRRAAVRWSVFMGAFGGEGGGDVVVCGYAEVDVLGSAGGGCVGLGEFVVGGGEADLESLGFAGPPFAFGFDEAGQEVGADFFEAVTLGGVDSEEWASDAGVLVNAGRRVCASAIAKGDAAALEVAEELVPFGVGGGCGTLRSAGWPCAGR